MNYWTHEAQRAKTWSGQSVKYAQHKFDGWRMMFFVQPDKSIVVFGRRFDEHLEFTRRFPSVIKHPAFRAIRLGVERAVIPPRTSFDCEVIATDSLRSSVITALKGPATGYQVRCFGVPWINNIASVDLFAQMQYASRIGLHITPTVLSGHVIDPEKTFGRNKQRLLKKAREQGIEGWVLKKGGGPFDKWYKVKPTPSVDCVVMDVKPGEGKYANMIGSIECGVYAQGALVSIASASGMTDGERLNMTQGHARGVLVGAVVELEYQIVGSKGRLTHPRFSRLRPDKPAAECTMDQIVES